MVQQVEFIREQFVEGNIDVFKNADGECSASRPEDCEPAVELSTFLALQDLTGQTDTSVLDKIRTQGTVSLCVLFVALEKCQMACLLLSLDFAYRKRRKTESRSILCWALPALRIRIQHLHQILHNRAAARMLRRRMRALQAVEHSRGCQRALRHAPRIEFIAHLLQHLHHVPKQDVMHGFGTGRDAGRRHVAQASLLRKMRQSQELGLRV